MASYGTSLPPGFAVDQPQQQPAASTYGAQLPAGFTVDQPQQNAAPAAPAQQPPAQQQPTVDTSALNQEVSLPFAPFIHANLGDVASFANALGDTASFGLAPAAMRTVQNIFAPGSGDETAQKIAAVNQAHPLGAAAGTVAAVPVDAMLTAPLGGFAEGVPLLKTLASGGGALGDLARLGTTGAAMGGLDAATHGGDVATGAVAGALGGAVIGSAAKPLISTVANTMGPAAIKAWRYLAGKLGEDPDQLLAHVQDFATRTGQQPSLQQVVSDHDAGVIAGFGKASAPAGEVLRQGAQASENALPQQAQDIINQSRPHGAGLSDILNARDTQMDAAIAPIADRQVSLEIPQDQFRRLVSRIPQEDRAPLYAALGVATEDEGTGPLTTTMSLRDVDTLRRDLNGLATGQNSLGKQSYAALSDLLEQQARDQVPQYGPALDRYALHSRYAEGFGHGETGAPINSAKDAGLRASLATPEGQQGYNHGFMSQLSEKAGGTPSEAAGVLGDISRPGAAQDQFQQAGGTAAQQDAAAALRTASQRTRSTAPGSLQPQPDSHAAAANLATAVAQAPIAPHGAVWHGIKAAFQIAQGAHLNAADATNVARHLVSADPADRARAIRMLRIGGASDSQIKLAQALTAAMAARAVTNYQGATQ